MVFGFQVPYARVGGRPFFVTEHVQSLANIGFNVPPQTDLAEDEKSRENLCGHSMAGQYTICGSFRSRLHSSSG